MDLFEKILIWKYVLKNKDKIKYNFSKIFETHEVKTEDDGKFVAIQTENDNNGQICLCLRYNIHNNKKHEIHVNKQSYFDKLFISKMYSKMLKYYQEKNNSTR